MRRLLFLAALSGCSAPPAPEPLFTEEAPTASPLPAAGPRFEDASARLGEVVHHAGRSDQRLMPEVLSGGVGLVDVNRDGALDVVLVDGGRLAGGPPAPEGRTRLLLGDGHGAFSDATDAWGLDHRGYGYGVAAGDVDGDGWIDLYLTGLSGAERLLRNTGSGFVDATAAWGLAPDGWSTSAAFLDADEDGDLDLYVARYVVFSPTDAVACHFRSIHIYCTPALYEALPDRFYRNEGGRFVDATTEAGLAGYDGKGLAVTTGDLDDDGHTDLYVANDITRNLLFRGRGDGTFEEAGVRAGVAFSQVGREQASMGAAVADADGDGDWDLAVTNFQGEPTALYTAASSSYRERSDALGLGAPSRERLSFGVEWLDVDNDGDEDLLQANGHIADNVATYREGVTFAQPNDLFLNRGGTLRRTVGGEALEVAGVSRGLAVGDVDGDGGLDYLVGNNDGPPQLALNRTADRGHWLVLWLDGRSPVGARVTARVGDRTLRREVRGASSYLSVSSRFVHLGLGDAAAVDELTVRWPDGTAWTGSSVEADRHLRLVPGGEPVPYAPGEQVLPP